jgi:hypothetical protein
MLNLDYKEEKITDVLKTIINYTLIIIRAIYRYDKILICFYISSIENSTIKNDTKYNVLATMLLFILNYKTKRCTYSTVSTIK